MQKPKPVAPLRLAARLRERLQAWSQAQAPREACGLMLGKRVAKEVWVEDISLGTNLATQHAPVSFDLDPAHFPAMEDAARARGLEVLGVWHSHPASAAIPSAADHAAFVPGWCYLILTLQTDSPQRLRCWRLLGGSVVEQPVGLGKRQVMRSLGTGSGGGEHDIGSLS